MAQPSSSAAAADAGLRCVHFVGFRDDRYQAVVKVWGRPDFIHRWWDRCARRDIGPDDVIVFATGEWRQEPSPLDAPDIDEDE